MDYNIWYNGRVIANIKALNDKMALKNARAIWGKEVTVTKEQ